MSIFFATFLPALFLIVMGASLIVSNSLVVSTFMSVPRSPVATAAFWGAGCLWFLYVVWNLSAADLVVFETSTPWVVFFAAIAIAAFYFVPDFLAVRGLCVLTLLAAWEVLMGTFGEYGVLLFLKVFVIVAVALAIYLGCVPYRARDILQWLFNRVQRARALGGLMVAYGVLLAAIAFLY